MAWQKKITSRNIFAYLNYFIVGVVMLVPPCYPPPLLPIRTPLSASRDTRPKNSCGESRAHVYAGLEQLPWAGSTSQAVLAPSIASSSAPPPASILPPRLGLWFCLTGPAALRPRGVSGQSCFSSSSLLLSTAISFPSILLSSRCSPSTSSGSLPSSSSSSLSSSSLRRPVAWPPEWSRTSVAAVTRLPDISVTPWVGFPCSL